jgi:hypothetical protein
MESGVGWTLADSDSRNLIWLAASLTVARSYLSVTLRISMGSSSNVCGAALSGVAVPLMEPSSSGRNTSVSSFSGEAVSGVPASRCSSAEPFWVFDLVALRISGEGESRRVKDLETRIGDGRALVATDMATTG